MIHPQLRRSLLYVPGNMPSMLQNIPIFSCDVCIIDLEDAVPRTEKDAARLLSRRFIEGYTQRNKEVYVRINGLDTPYFRDDLAQILPAMPDGIRLPKCEHPSHLRRIDDLLTEFEEYLGCEIGRFKVIASVESAQGIINVNETARASSRLVALGFSAEDYTANLQIDRPKTGEHLVVPRQLLLMACRAANIQAIDTVWDHMKNLPAVTLSRITHLSGSAWSKAVENKSRFVGNVDMAEDHTFDAYLKV